MRKKYKEQLYLTLNLGCSGICGLCPTKNTVSCKCVTLTNLIDWNKLEKILSNPEIKTVTLFGGESPFINFKGHNIIFSRLMHLIKEYKKELIVISDYRGLCDTGFVRDFKKLYLKVYSSKLITTSESPLWLKSYTDVVTYTEVDYVTSEVIDYIRDKYKTTRKPIIITEGKRIPYLKKAYPDIEFRDSLFCNRIKTYSISENKLYSSCRSKGKTWREKIKID